MKKGVPWGGQVADLSTPLRQGGRLSPLSLSSRLEVAKGSIEGARARSGARERHGPRAARP